MRNLLSFRFVLLFFAFAVVLAWLLPDRWVFAPAAVRTPLSPHAEAVRIEDVSWGAGHPYVSISVGEVGSPVTLTGWSVENHLGARAEIGSGVERYVLGAVNLESPILVGTGSSAILSFGPSPIGVSFRENACSAYLRGTLPFVPLMERSCPDVRSSPLYGGLDATCRALIDSSPKCETVSPEHVAIVTPRCEEFLRVIPTYAHCMEGVGNAAIGASARWRIYLPGNDRMISESGGSIILVDGKGLLVDEFPYPAIGLSE